MFVFGTMPDGAAVHCIPLREGTLSCEILTYGAAVRSLIVPDREGNAVDVALGYDRLEDYRAHTAYMGAVAGRFANRIGGSSFVLNGERYALPANDGANHLHGGQNGFDKRVWTVEHAAANVVTLSLQSPDGDMGYPGNLTVWVTYRLTDDALEIHYRAISDRDTICNLTNHTYFNLSGHNSGSAEGQQITMFADHYTPADAASIPTGELASVDGTPMDLRQPTRIGAHIDEPFAQLQQAGGYDHNWVVRGTAGTIRPAARAYAADTGITLTVETDRPGIQFYAGNFLPAAPLGKGGAVYGRRCGYALETQTFPDAPNHENFPTAVLRGGAVFESTTIYRFSGGTI